MIARRYEDRDFQQVASWLQARGEYMFKRSHLPELGWIVDDLAAAFLLQPDCSIVIIEFFVTNPMADEADRLKATDLIIDEIEQEALSMNKDMIVGSTKIAKVMALGKRYGFSFDPTPYFFFRKELDLVSMEVA